MERHTLAKYLMELTLLDYNMVHYRPSEVAAAALCLSQLLLEGLPWVSLRNRRLKVSAASRGLCLQSPVQQHYSTYGEAHLKPIVQHVAKNVVMVTEGKTKFVVSEPGLPGVAWRSEAEVFAPLQAVKNKYSSSKLLKISLLPQLKSALVKNMAAPLLNS